MEQSFKKGVVLNLASLVEYSEGGVISKQLIKSPAGNVTLFSFDKGEGLSEHRAPVRCYCPGAGRCGRYCVGWKSIYLERRRKHCISG